MALTHVNRRALIVGAAGFALAGTMPAAAATASGRHRLAVATWPFRARIDAPLNGDRDPTVTGSDLAGFGIWAGREFGVAGIEALDRHMPPLDPASLADTRRRLAAAGLHICNIAVDDPADIAAADPQLRANGHAVYAKWIGVAKQVGSPSVRFSAPAGQGLADIAGPAAALRAIAPLARRSGVVIVLENGNSPRANAARTLAIVKRANSPWIRTAPDFGSALVEGEAGNTAAVAALFPFAATVADVKDAEIVNGQRRVADMAAIFAAARAARFRGLYAIESDTDAEPVADTHRLIDATLRLMRG